MVASNVQWRIADELEWLVPATSLTVWLAAFSLLGTPDYSGILPVLGLLPLWLLAAFVLSGFVALASVLRMMRAGVEHPFAHCLSYLRSNWGFLLFVSFALTLAGLNMIAFMWAKPLLNYLVPFSADPLLASVDHAIFRTDPWRLLKFLNITPLAIFYHKAWFALMIVTLLSVVMRQPSRQRSAILLTYFLLWSIFGPLVHTVLPAAGPVFYAKLGYGNQFAGLQMEQETQRIAQYLWSIYSTRGFGGGAGISAMPSLHIATTVWMIIVVGQFAKRWLMPMMVAAMLIFLLSVSLGWHYAIDGAVGALGAYGIWKFSSSMLFLRSFSLDAARAG
jgi:hypothetical protein